MTLVEMPPRAPDAPDPFSFADPEHVTQILHQAGWSGIDICPYRTEVAVGGRVGLREAALHAYEFGPVKAVAESTGQVPSDLDAQGSAEHFIVMPPVFSIDETVSVRVDESGELPLVAQVVLQRLGLSAGQGFVEDQHLRQVSREKSRELPLQAVRTAFQHRVAACARLLTRTGHCR